MSRSTDHRVLDALLERHGQTYAKEAGVRLGKGTPAPLFQLLCLALLLSARIRSELATQPARALWAAELTTPRKMANATWQQRVDVLTSHGYKRYDERTSTQLGELTDRVLDDYGGDLRRLRDRADRDVDRERVLLQEFKGIGGVGADIYLREIQALWPEARPYVDARVVESARQLGLARKPSDVARLVPPRALPRLSAALVRVGKRSDREEFLAKHEPVRQA